MHAIDKEIGEMSVFNQKEDRFATDGADDENSKLSGITSVQ